MRKVFVDINHNIYTQQVVFVLSVISKNLLHVLLIHTQKQTKGLKILTRLPFIVNIQLTKPIERTADPNKEGDVFVALKRRGSLNNGKPRDEESNPT